MNQLEDSKASGAQRPVQLGLASEHVVSIDGAGRVSLPDEARRALGGTTGGQLRLAVRGKRVELLPDIHTLDRLYVEPTSVCNLACRTCVRRTWDEPQGSMDRSMFDTLIGQLAELRGLRSVMFAGFGEPTTHPDIVHMVAATRALGLQVEMTTNGTLLSRELLEKLHAARLDRLWVSLDGTDEACYEAIRSGADYGDVLHNLAMLREVNAGSGHRIELGIAFVAMRGNLDEMARLGRLAEATGAGMVSVSNVLPYSRDMQAEMLCSMELSSVRSQRRPWHLNLPLLDLTPATRDALFALLRSRPHVSLLSQPLGPDRRQCRFIEDRCTFVRWDGIVSPCMGLLHSHTAYTRPTEAERHVKHYGLGSIADASLKEIWDSAAYRAFRDRVHAFEFSHCSSCGGCQYSESNEEDCFGNDFPTCGGCLWSRGVIQCP